MKLLSKLKELDWYLVAPLTYLIVIGLVIQHAIIFKTRGSDVILNLEPHILAVGLAVAVAGLFAFSPTTSWRKLAPWLYWATVFMLVLVVFFGSSGGGAERWLRVGGMQVQPSELAKLATIMLLAKMLDNRSAAVNRVRMVLQSIVIVAIPVLLTMIQPDLGSALVFVFIWISMILASKMRFSRIALIFIVVASATIMLIPFLADYQQQRLVSYFNPNQDTQGINYNTIQAGIAIGSGGLTGNGLDSGSQSQLNFLPSQHTDFVFAVVGEKLGLIGAASVVIAQAALTIRMLAIARSSTKHFERGIVIGVAALISFHAIVNIGMNVGILPVTGIPLPLLSYGGTFMFVAVLSVLLVVILEHRTRHT